MKGKEHKPHIGIFGRRNYGKSTLLNRMTGQDLAIVSEHPGTTTDPVRKSVELPGVGPVVMIDTAGIDDDGSIGAQRVLKSLEILKTVDLALLMVHDNQINTYEEELIRKFVDSDTPYILVYSKTDLVPPDPAFLDQLTMKYKVPLVTVNCNDPQSIDRLLSCTVKTIPESSWKKHHLIGDRISYGDIVLLITPIDIEAPEGRLILPQVQTIRDILDHDAIAIVVKEREVDAFLKRTGIKPALVVCDSSVILKADASIPGDIPLTGFSIMLARYKGAFDKYLEGTPQINRLQHGDRVLMLESCTHHVSCDDIGRVKIPRWMSSFTGRKLSFDIVSGLSKLERPVTDYALIVQCGGCMVTRKQLENRLKPAIEAGIPVTNYGMAIAWMQGVYKRAIAPFVQVGLEDML